MNRMSDPHRRRSRPRGAPPAVPAAILEAAILAAILAAAVLAAVGLSSGAAAQSFGPDAETPSAPRNDERVVRAEDWREISRGRTVYWRENGAFSGREYYAPNGRDVTFIAPDGTCLEGVWGPKRNGAPGELCFRYSGPNYEGTHCDLHLRRGETLFARRPSGRETFVIKMTDETLSCGPSPTS
ncbi:MAG: hypothetical protein AAFW46_13515 [Pseudomonadota bacterium]